MRSTTVRESEWDEQQRAWFLALAQHESELCPLCGRPLAVCTAPDAEWDVTVPAPTRCHYSTAVAMARVPYEKTPNNGALMFTARSKRLQG